MEENDEGYTPTHLTFRDREDEEHNSYKWLCMKFYAEHKYEHRTWPFDGRAILGKFENYNGAGKPIYRLLAFREDALDGSPGFVDVLSKFGMVYSVGPDYVAMPDLEKVQMPE